MINEMSQGELGLPEIALFALRPDPTRTRANFARERKLASRSRNTALEPAAYLGVILAANLTVSLHRNDDRAGSKVDSHGGPARS